MISEAFSFDWDKPLPDEERNRLIDHMSSQVARRGLTSAAIWMLEIHRPLMPIAGQGAIAFSPFLATLFAGGPTDLQKYSQLLRDPNNVDLMINAIEQKTEEVALATRK